MHSVDPRHRADDNVDNADDVINRAVDITGPLAATVPTIRSELPGAFALGTRT